MHVRGPIRGDIQSGRSVRQVTERQTVALLRLDVRDEDDLGSVHRRTRQIASLLGFDVSQQTQIGTAVSLMMRAALNRAGAGTLEFWVKHGANGALCVSIGDDGPPKPEFQSRTGDDLGIDIARHLVSDMQTNVSDSGAATVFLRWLLAEAEQPLTIERVDEIRRVLSSDVPKTLVQELRAQNHELREMQQAFVLSELSLRQQIRQSTLMSEVAEALIGTESIAAKLQRCAEEIVQQLGVECALVWTADPSDEGVTLSANAGISSADFPQRPELGNSSLDLVLRERKTHVTNSVLEDPRTADREWAIRHEIQTFAGYPLLLADAMFGALVVYARKLLAPDVRDALKLVANQIAVGIDREQRTAENQRLFAAEIEARQKAERATQARDSLLAVVSHDLRNPLSSLFTAAALLVRSPSMSDDPRLRRHLDTILNSAGQMKRLVSDLIDLVSIEAGRLSFELKRQSVAPLVSQVAQSYAPMAEAKSIRLEATADDSLPEIQCDRGRILQVLSNLLGNAVKFTPEGGAISLRAFRSGSVVLLAVTDTGPGISEEEQRHVFDSYWQAKPGAGRGLGLGLSIAKALVESHGGRIWVESQPEHGSTFFVSLPAQEELTRAEDRVAS